MVLSVVWMLDSLGPLIGTFGLIYYNRLYYIVGNVNLIRVVLARNLCVVKQVYFFQDYF